MILLGFPYDTGVEINMGRPGARHGPEKFRSWIRRYGTVDNPEMNIDLSGITLADAGDIPTGLPLDQSHTALTQQTTSILQKGGIPFIIGGGNDQSYPNARALLDSKPGIPVGVINVDAHLDVRPLKDGQAHSGSPFRLLLEDSRFSGSQFIEFAAQGSQVSRSTPVTLRTRKDTSSGIRKCPAATRRRRLFVTLWAACLGNVIPCSSALISIRSAPPMHPGCPAPVSWACAPRKRSRWRSLPALIPKWTCSTCQNTIP